MTKEALLSKKLDDSKVQCLLCNHFCIIDSDKTGQCQVRKNIGGVLYALNYGQVITANIDPIEKKPLNHFLPGTKTYSIACPGCNLKCRQCQNADISQVDNYFALELVPTMSPAEIISEAKKHQCPSIAYTYTEPTVFFEFALDCMKLARQKNIKNIWVSNGFMSLECLKSVRPFLDAVNIDLKFFSDETYRKITGAQLQPVLDNLIWLKKNKIHLEVTTLIIPTINDSLSELKQSAKFIFEKLGADTPWHVNTFYPAYKLAHLSPTPIDIILQAQTIGLNAGLKYVHLGNI